MSKFGINAADARVDRRGIRMISTFCSRLPTRLTPFVPILDIPGSSCLRVWWCTGEGLVAVVVDVPAGPLWQARVGRV